MFRNKFTLQLLVLFAALTVFLSCNSALTEAKVGKPIPAWQKGELDIHFINTGTGECTYIIMPDGTQMLVDMAGAITSEDDEMFMPYIPDNSRRPGEWINRYMSRCMEWTGNEKLDYVSVTHFHGDHVGNCPDHLPFSTVGDWQMTSFTDIIEGNDVELLVDRAYPDYSYPRDLKNVHNIKNYLKCVNWHVENEGMQVARFIPGVNDQFVMKYAPEQYPDFSIRNIAVNGLVWTGVGTEVKTEFPDQSTFVGPGKSKDHSPSENAVSSVFKLSYGDFDYYGGGDVTQNGQKYFDWKDVESPIADAVGRVEVMKSDHHGSSDSNNKKIVRTLSPQAVIINVWRNVQPKGGISKYLGPEVNEGKTDVFLTNLDESLAHSFGEEMSRVLSRQGHIVIRVAPGGASYFIYILEDSDESMAVKSIHGPYQSR